MTNLQTLTLQQQSYVLATCSQVAYKNIDQANKIFNTLGFAVSVYADNKGSQAYIVESESDLIVVCRGTEPTKYSDIKADLQVKKNKFEDTDAHVHHGFYQSVKNVWDILYKEVKDTKKNVYVTGHSLGAAMATLISVKLALLNIQSTLFTYGSPRVGNSKFIDIFNQANITHYRFVNNVDIVTEVPRFRFKHTGKIMYMNHWGNIRDLTVRQRIKDRVRGLIKGWINHQIVFFTNHSIERYCDNLNRWQLGIENDQTMI